MDPVFDHLVLTASNPAQARAYRRQLAEREAEGGLRGIGAWHVMEDPGGRRVGSGAATFLALRALARGRGGAAFVRRARVLVLHSGGDSRRLPAFAALGKAFVPLPVRDARGRPAALMDLILRDLCEAARGGLGAKEARLVVACGDVYLGMGTAGVSLSGEGVRCAAFRAPFRVAARHGVFVVDGSGKVTRVLQKPGRREAAGAGRGGKFLVDSGVFSFAPEASLRVLRGLGAGPSAEREGTLGKIARGEAPALDLYQDIPTAALARHGEDRLRGALRGTPFSVSVLPRCEFLHVGTTRELLALPERLLRTGLPEGFARAAGDWRVLRDRRERMVVGLDRIPGWLPVKTGLAVLPVGARRWAALTFGVDDDFKASCEAGGTLLGRPLASWDDGGLWPRGADHTLWSARIWRTGSRREMLRIAAGLCAGRLPRPSQGGRMALSDLVRRVNGARLAEALREADREGLLRDLGPRATVWALPAPTIAGLAGSAREARRVAAAAEAHAQRAARDGRARWWRIAQLAYERWPALRGRAARCEGRVFESIAREYSEPRRVKVSGAARRSGVRVVATAPARVDLAGGWSDTPPMCHRFGGLVVNAAIGLNGGHAMEVTCTRLEEPQVRVRSIDLGRVRAIRTAAALRRFDDPRDWTALARGAVVLSGMCPPRGGPTLREWLRDRGGVEITMHSRVPKGSGLGTSSILGATILAAVAALDGRGQRAGALLSATSRLEQLITTGGGWQDQAGGLLGGIKVVTTTPGTGQAPRIERVRSPGFERLLSERGVLYYTGEQRLARDILRSVVGRFVDEDPAALRLLVEIKAEARRLSTALRRDEPELAVACLTRALELKCLLDPGTTTANIRALLGEVRPLLSGWCTPGAGGGGYVLLIARSRADRETLERLLARREGPAGAGVTAWSIDHRGLRVSVERDARLGARGEGVRRLPPR
ncbi:MAG: hypothetical protein IT433_00045 [Phycisphaerales bacterium]|nr:hypothetical protein [Phycisphaerales bacterium]